VPLTRGNAAGDVGLAGFGTAPLRTRSAAARDSAHFRARISADGRPCDSSWSSRSASGATRSNYEPAVSTLCSGRSRSREPMLKRITERPTYVAIGLISDKKRGRPKKHMPAAVRVATGMGSLCCPSPPIGESIRSKEGLQYRDHHGRRSEGSELPRSCAALMWVASRLEGSVVGLLVGLGSSPRDLPQRHRTRLHVFRPQMR
jgi:hypothetical protein